MASDSFGAARLAAEHLLERGLRHFAYVGVHGRVWSERRREGFSQRVHEAGFEARVYAPPRATRDRDWEREQPVLARWLSELPRPIGLLACDDERGREVLEACRVGGRQVPEEIAVVGVDNDELLCELADPPLSSVALNAEAGGYRAAALLDQMMRARLRGRATRTRARRLLIEPLRVVTRRSTDIIAQGDPEIAAALRFLQDHAGELIGVSDVVKRLLISRRALEIRFRQAVGRTIREELERIRLERAKRLLLETDHSIARVAEAAGFHSSSYLAQVFRKSFGQTPARYRMQGRTPALEE